MSREDPQMKIRLPADLKARIEEASSANNRTMNAEIVARLGGSFAGFIDKDLTLKMLHEEVSRLTDELRELRGAKSDLMSKIAPEVEEQIRSVMGVTGLSFEEALLLVVSRGAVLETAVPLVILQVAKETTLDQARALMGALNECAPPDASAMYERKDVPETRLLSSEGDKTALLAATRKATRSK